MPSLFAGKLHAVLCRAWKSRVKGRDLYDYVFYLSNGTPVNLKHLNARLVDSGFEGARKDMSLDEIKESLYRRFEGIDYVQTKMMCFLLYAIRWRLKYGAKISSSPSQIN